MRRRDFLSMLSCAALSAVVPRPKYFFLNGVWQRPEVLISYDASLGPDQSCLMFMESNPRNTGAVWVREIWYGEKAEFMYQKIANGEWEAVPNLRPDGKPPFVVVDLADPPWMTTPQMPPELLTRRIP